MCAWACACVCLLTLSQGRIIEALKRNEKEAERWRVDAGERGGDRGSNLCVVSPMPDEIHHSFDEERPWGADLMGGIGRGMAPICRSILLRFPHHWRDRRVFRERENLLGSIQTIMNTASLKKEKKRVFTFLLCLGDYEGDFEHSYHWGNISLKACHLFVTWVRSWQGDSWRMDEDGEHVQGPQLATCLRS